MMPGPMEIAIIAGIVLIIFGPRQIPKMGKALGETIREFRGVGRELTEAGESVRAEVQSAVDVVQPPPPPRRAPMTHVLVVGSNGVKTCIACGRPGDDLRPCPARNGHDA